MTAINVSAGKIMSSITLKVRFERVAGLRLWFGIRLMKLAAFVAGCGIEIESGDRRPTARPDGILIRSDVDAPGYDASFGQRVRIMLDGVEQKNVTAYDLDAGTLTRLKTDAAGKLVIDRAEGKVARETVKGMIEVEWRESASPAAAPAS